MIEITNIQIRHTKVESSRLKAIASILIDDCFAVHDIKIIEGAEGLFIAMPSKKAPNGNFNDIVHPINSETRELLSNAILNAYNESIKNN